MKRVALICVSLLLIACLLSGCVPKEEAPPPEGELTPPEEEVPPPTIDWSEISIPSIGEEGNWVLAPGLTGTMTPVFAADGKTIYGLIDNEDVFLFKSDDGGHAWTRLPGIEELGLMEAFNIKVVGDNLFISSLRTGIYRSSNGGKTFQEMPLIPGKTEGPQYFVFCFDAALDALGKPVLIAGTHPFFPPFFGGLWMLSHPYETWVDMRVGNAESGTKYNVCQAAFSPNYAKDGQIVAVVSDWQHLRVTMKYGDEAWGERIADAQIPDDQTDYDAFMVSDIGFPNDYDPQKPALFLGTATVTEYIPSTPQYTDAYRIDGMPAGSSPSIATDLDVGGEGTSTPICSIAVKGPADSATILAGGIGQVYRSTDGGQSWQGAVKPPTGGGIWRLAFAPRGEGSVVYCMSSYSWDVMVPRDAKVPVGESAFCRSVDGGITWNQLSMIGTTIDETISHAVSPNYAKDKTMFMLTRSRCSATVPFNEGETVVITRDPDSSGTTAKVIVVNHGGNPPEDVIVVDGEYYPAGGAWTFALDDNCPSITVHPIPWLSQPGMLEWVKENMPPQFLEQYLTLSKQPRKVVIYVLDGSVTVTKGEQVEEEGEGGRISVDGDASDWQGIEPLATDPEGDAPSADEDLKAFYATNDSKYLYLMVEFYGQNPRLRCDILLDTDFDGVEDHVILIESPDGAYGPATRLLKPPNVPDPECMGEDIASFGRVLEARLPLEVIGNLERLHITCLHLTRRIHGEEFISLDRWEGSLEVNIEEFAAPAPAPTPSSLSIPFPSTESLWKTTDGGTIWKRILTSNLKLLIDDKEIQVGPLESVTLSDNFARDNTLFVYEGGDNPRMWVSTDGGATFTLQK